MGMYGSDACGNENRKNGGLSGSGTEEAVKMIKQALGIGVAVAVTLASASGFAAGMVAYKIVDDAIPEPLTKEAGNADRGREVMVNRRLGNCLACHKVTVMESEPFHGEVGPSLDGAGSRWTEGQLRLIMTNSKALFPDTIMPAFYRNDDFKRVRKGFEDKTILTEQQVEDVIAFLKTLKD